MYLFMEKLEILKIYEMETDSIQWMKDKKCHIVTLAYLGLNFSNEYIKVATNNDEKFAFDLVQEICTKKETGSLFPVANLTLIPVEYLHYPVMGGRVISEDNYTENQFREFIEDAFKAETEYIKSGKMVFDFRDRHIKNPQGSPIQDMQLYNIVEDFIKEKFATSKIKFVFLLKENNSDFILAPVLKSVGGDLDISGNTKININSFPKLKHIGGSFIAVQSDINQIFPSIEFIGGNCIVSSSNTMLIESAKEFKRKGVIMGDILLSDI